MDSHDSRPSSPPYESDPVDMEAAMEKLDLDSKDTHHKSNYVDEPEHVKQTMQAISHSAAVRAKEAMSLQNCE